MSTRHDNAICVRGSPPPLAARAEKANVFFIHGANVSEQDGRAWTGLAGPRGEITNPIVRTYTELAKGETSTREVLRLRLFGV